MTKLIILCNTFFVNQSNLLLIKLPDSYKITNVKFCITIFCFRSTESSKKNKLSKVYVDLIKQSVVNVAAGEAMDDGETPKWQKARLVLFKASGGYALEFYVPPKVSIIK